MELIAVDPQIEVVRIKPFIDIVLSSPTMHFQSIEADVYEAQNVNQAMS